jgi:hypothetical protein
MFAWLLRRLVKSFGGTGAAPPVPPTPATGTWSYTPQSSGTWSRTPDSAGTWSY